MYKNIELQDNKRIIVISDIHGEIDLFLTLLDKCQFSNNDYLIILGDIIEKGNDNLNTLRYIMNLSKKSNVFVVKGNCDRVLEYSNMGLKAQNDILNYLKDNQKSIFIEGANELGVKIDSIDNLIKVSKHLEEESSFIQSLPAVLVSEQLVFAHAGIRSLKEDNYRYIYGTRTFYEDGHDLNQYVIVGHLPVKNLAKNILNLNPLYDFDRKIIAIDGGNVVAEGQLNALIIENNHGFLSFTHRFACSYPMQLFKKKQKGNDMNQAKKIVWPDFEVEIIEIKAGGCLVKNKKGDTIYVKNDYLKKENGVAMVNGDYTDYYHTLEGKEIGYIIKEDVEDYLVNINGIIGWITKGE